MGMMMLFTTTPAAAANYYHPAPLFSQPIHHQFTFTTLNPSSSYSHYWYSCCCSSWTKPSLSSSPFASRPSVSLQDTGDETTPSLNPLLPPEEEEEEASARIRRLFDDVDVSMSFYDTAWLAMVPNSSHHHQEETSSPLFPQCIDCLLYNQLPDGSWPTSVPHHPSLFIKDALSSTLACLLALKKWGVGSQQVHKGVRFLELNFASSSASDDSQPSPVGFDIIFPAMLLYATTHLNLSLRLDPSTLDALFHKRDLELARLYESDSHKSKAYLAFVSEGLVNLQNWDTVLQFQRSNGSLFNSPSATAAAVMHLHNPSCLNYLHSALQKFGNAVPAVYPLDIYARLCLVDNLERLGICRHFKKEILIVLDHTYRCWLQGDDEIFAEPSTCAIAFTLLRKHGYDISADSLTQIFKEECFSNPLGEYPKDITSIPELYRASELMISENEIALEKQKLWSKNLLKEHISSCHGSMRFSSQISKQVDDTLELPFHATLQRVANRRSIEHYSLDNIKILKTSYCSSNFGNKDLLILAVKDFNQCQLIHREELQKLERWVADNRLDKLNFARQKSAYCYFSAAATIFSPELSDARMSWAKNGVLTTVVDDFFDVGGSPEELNKLIELIEKWDVNVDSEACSEPVKILFSALHSTICEIGDKAFKWQSWDVTNHIIEIWLNLLHSMLREAEWARDKSVPTIDEYMKNGYVSFALGPIILPALFLVGPKLSEAVIKGPEIHSLFKLVSTCGRLLNDIQGFKREAKDGKLNALSLLLIQEEEGVGGISEADAIAELKSLIENHRTELLRLVLLRQGSVVPRACKDLFWNMSRVVHLFYLKDDGFTSGEMIQLVKSIIYEPLPSIDFD